MMRYHPNWSNRFT